MGLKHGVFLCILACSLAIPQPPVLPDNWYVPFTGLFLGSAADAGCHHSGWMYFNATARLLKTNWLFGAGCEAEAEAELAFKIDVNDGMAQEIRNYIVRHPGSEFSCSNIPLPNWWTPTYLREARTVFNGTATLTLLSGEKLPCFVYHTVDLFISGYVLSFVSQASNALVRMTVMQGPGEDYFTDFGPFVTAAPGTLTPDVINVFPALNCT